MFAERSPQLPKLIRWQAAARGSRRVARRPPRLPTALTADRSAPEVGSGTYNAPTTPLNTGMPSENLRTAGAFKDSPAKTTANKFARRGRSSTRVRPAARAAAAAQAQARGDLHQARRAAVDGFLHHGRRAGPPTRPDCARRGRARRRPPRRPPPRQRRRRTPPRRTARRTAACRSSPRGRRGGGERRRPRPLPPPPPHRRGREARPPPPPPTWPPDGRAASDARQRGRGSSLRWQEGRARRGLDGGLSAR